MKSLLEGKDILKEEQEDIREYESLVEGQKRLKSEEEDMREQGVSGKGAGEVDRGLGGPERVRRGEIDRETEEHERAWRVWKRGRRD